MPSWPPRLYLGSPAPDPRSKSRARASKGPQYREDQIGENMYLDQPCHGVPVLILTSSSSPSRPSHRRSYSHPFPSIFGSGKKAKKISENVSNEDALNKLNKSPLIPIVLASKDQMASNGNCLQKGEKHFITGRCSTCNSRVRWPRHLDVFRCTVCLMVNDMKPSVGLLTGGREAEGLVAAVPPSGPDSPRKGTMNPMNILVC